MRIAFNATALISPLTGIGQYAFELAQRLAADPAHQAEFFYGMAWSRQVRRTPLPAAGTVLPAVRSLVPGAYMIRRFVQAQAFARRVRKGGFDLYHEPNFLPHAFDGPTVTTVHDLSWIRHPESHPVERVRAMNRYFEPGLRRSSLVLTDSHFVRQEVIDVFGLAPERVRAVPLGASAMFRPHAPGQTEAVRQAPRLEHGGYLLAVGTLEPRKNLPATLRAYAGLPEALQKSFPLVVAGMKGWRGEELEREMRPLLASGRVRLAGYLSRPDLAALVAGAAALVYPSFYEGFGLPPLEAMACGVPTIVSNVASLPEVVGDTGLMVDPHDVDALRAAMRQLLDDPALRETLGAGALVRAAGFNWDRCAAETLSAYRDAAGA